MKTLTTLLLVLSALAFGACANNEPQPTATYSGTRSTTSYSK